MEFIRFNEIEWQNQGLEKRRGFFAYFLAGFYK